MNTNPDETKMALWLDDELHGEELAAFEATAGSQPEMIAAREDVRRWRALMASAVPAAVDPPYPEFFNTRVERAIRVPVAVAAASVPKKQWWFFRQSVLVPMAACVGMAFTFWLGTETSRRTNMAGDSAPPRTVAVESALPKTLTVEPLVYTPENGVEAERFTSSPAAATVILLSGVDEIPDDTDFSKSTSFNDKRDLDATAAVESQSNDLMEL